MTLRIERLLDNAFDRRLDALRRDADGAPPRAAGVRGRAGACILGAVRASTGSGRQKGIR